MPVVIPDPKRRRRGMILPIVLLGLLAVMLVGAVTAQRLVSDRRNARGAEQRQQALWLAEAALHRAIAKQARQADYEGETWSLSGDVLGSGREGVAVITVTPVDAPRRGRLVTVEARYPLGGTSETRYEREQFLPQKE